MVDPTADEDTETGTMLPVELVSSINSKQGLRECTTILAELVVSTFRWNGQWLSDSSFSGEMESPIHHVFGTCAANRIQYYVSKRGGQIARDVFVHHTRPYPKQRPSRGCNNSESPAKYGSFAGNASIITLPTKVFMAEALSADAVAVTDARVLAETPVASTSSTVM